MRVPEHDPKLWRIVPRAYGETFAVPVAQTAEVSLTWPVLGKALEEANIQGLGIVLPFAWQQHFAAYQEANKRGVITAVAMPTNVSALTGLMRNVEIDAVITNDVGARNLLADLTEVRMLERIRLWVVLSTKEEQSSFDVPGAIVVHDLLP